MNSNLKSEFIGRVTLVELGVGVQSYLVPSFPPAMVPRGFEDDQSSAKYNFL